MKKMNKKGFTLAELLIVVAIIAVLTAIAVPLFVGALNDANDNVKYANERAVRGAAIEQLLTMKEGDALYSNFYYTSTTATDGNPAGTLKHDTIYATAFIEADGNISEVSLWEAAPTNVTGVTANFTQSQKLSDGKYYICIKIENLKASLGKDAPKGP